MFNFFDRIKSFKLCHGNVFLFVIIVLFMTTVFKTNFINSFDTAFRGFQYDSEDLAIGKITAVHYRLNTGWYGLGRVACQSVKKGLASEEIYELNKEDKTMQFHGYGSSIGLQGKIFSRLNKFIYVKHICSAYRYINCLLLATVLTGICWLIAHKFGKLMAIIWGGVFTLSPWIVDFARNLYWVEFTWFIPMLLGLILVYDKMKFPHKDEFIYFAAFVSVAIKSACGYEYLSSVLLGMVMFPLVELFDLYTSGDKLRAKILLRKIVIMSICAVVGFLVALLVHGYYRGSSNILSGLKSIYQNDVLRRTLGGDPVKFHKVYANSLNASVWDVVAVYFRYWDNAFAHDIILGINGKFFVFMTSVTFVIIFVKLFICRLYKEYSKVLLMLILSMLIAVSWYVLGKSHSYIHRHMNYVLWYFGYVQVCFYVIVDSVWDLVKHNVSGEKNE